MEAQEKNVHATVRCKFKCESVSVQMGGHYDSGRNWIPSKVHGARLFAVHDGSPENESFFAATPSGHLEVSTTLWQPFEPGREYFLDLSLVPLAEAKPEPKCEAAPAKQAE